MTDNLKIEGIGVMAHSFYDEQPARGEVVEGVLWKTLLIDDRRSSFHLHHITHDYDDETCLKILRAIAPAIRAGHSKLLIDELVLPSQGSSLVSYGARSPPHAVLERERANKDTIHGAH